MLSELLSQPVAAVFAAGIAALVALIVSILTKESKTSEFRQQWIDAVRSDLAEFMTAIGALRQLRDLTRLPAMDLERQTEVFYRILPMLETGSVRGVRLLLRLNPKEHAEIIKLVDQLMEVGTLTEESFESQTKQLMEHSQTMLKLEWRRVKRGELAFRVAKWSAIFIVVVALFFVCWQSYFALMASGSI